MDATSEMSLGLERSNWYLRGIRRAEEDGLISYSRANGDNEVGVSDDYGHIRHGDGEALLLKYTNTRPLSFIARLLLNLYRNPDFRFLELGPGAGVACATVKRLLPDATIDTVSLTPINPYLRFRWDDVYDHIAGPPFHNKCASRFYSACPHPFVHTQYIGHFPREVGLPKEKYHFVYENHGAIFYGFQPYGNDEPMECARASISAALSLLRRDGTMLIMASDGSYRMEEAVESVATDTDVIVICKPAKPYHSCPCIVARTDSPLSMRFRDGENGIISKSERVLRVEAEALEEVIAKSCLLRK